MYDFSKDFGKGRGRFKCLWKNIFPPLADRKRKIKKIRKDYILKKKMLLNNLSHEGKEIIFNHYKDNSLLHCI